MALVPTISVCVEDACTKIVFRETTGAYNASTNTGGYGAPNPSVGSVTGAELVVTPPTGNAFVVDMTAEGWPTTNEDLEFEVPIDSYEDGIWTFQYSVVSGDMYTATKTSIFYCNIKCCINTLLLNIDTDSVTLNDKQVQEYMRAKTYLDSLIHYAHCGNTDKFDNIKLILDRICAKSGCETCN